MQTPSKLFLPALWVVACLTLAGAAWFGLIAAALATGAAQYEKAPNCATSTISTTDCVAGVSAVVDRVTRRRYGLVVVSQLQATASGRSLEGDVVDAAWGVVPVSPRDTVAVTSWQGFLTAVDVRGEVHHTWQNPYVTRQWLTWIATGCLAVGLLVALAYLTAVDIANPPDTGRRRPWAQRADAIGLAAFLIVTVVVGSIPSLAARFVLLAIAWAGLAAFLITSGRGTASAWLDSSQRNLRTPRQYAIVTASRVVLAVFVLAFIVTSAAGVTRYALT